MELVKQSNQNVLLPNLNGMSSDSSNIDKYFILNTVKNLNPNTVDVY